MIVLVFVFLTISVHGEESKSEKIPKELNASEIMDMIQNNESVEYDHIVVNGNINLRKLDHPTNVTTSIRLNDSIFNGSVIFTDIILDESIDLSGSNFYSNVVFKKTIFNDYADFGDAKFGKYSKFEGATFSGSANFQKTAFDKTTYFNNVLFKDSLNFGEATFREEAEFKRATFWYSDFSRAIFSEDADFAKAIFNGEADFGRTTFSEDANFIEATFLEDANFGGGGIMIRGHYPDPKRITTFNGDADFNKAIFRGYADFGGANFFKHASFVDTIFNGNADFGKANFRLSPSFSRSTFNKDLDLGEAIFRWDTSFIGGSFNGDVNFKEAQFNKTARLSETTFKGYLFGWEDIKNVLDCDEATYLELIKNFKEHGQFSEADDCYYVYRYRYINSIWDFVSLVFCGFGVRPLYTVYWSFIIIVIFGLSYWIGKGIYKISAIQEDATIKGRTWNLDTVRITLISHIIYLFKYLNRLPKRVTNFLHESRSIDISKISGKLWRKSFTTNLPLNDCLYFSALVFFTLHPPHGWEYSARWRYVVLFEDVLGGIFITLFIVTLSNIMIRY